MKVRYRLDPLIKVREVEFLIRRVEVIAVQPKTHKDDFYPQLAFEDAADGDAAAAAEGDGRLVEGGLDGAGCRLVGLAVDGGHIGLAAMMLLGLDGDAGGSDFYEIIEEEGCDGF